MPKIRRITIKNFRSIAELRIDASDLTVIVGDNDCGKSNVLRALNLFFTGQTNPGVPFNFATDYNRFAEPGAKQAREIIIELTLDLPHNYHDNNGHLVVWQRKYRADGLGDRTHMWGIRQVPKKRGKGFKEEFVEITPRSRVPSLLNRIQFEYVPAVRSAEFFRGLRGRIYEVIAQASENKVRESSVQFEAVIGGAVEGLLKDISDELQDDSRLQLPNDLTSIFESLDFLVGEKSISLDNRGDGIKARYIPLILKFIAEKGREGAGTSPTFIWAYEEPENNLEFRRAQQLADAFKKLAKGEHSQVFLTTHSPVFYNMHQHEEDGDICAAYHLTHLGPEEGTQARSAEEANETLDESMGAMAIIAPHIKAAQEALAEATAQAEDLKAKLAKHNAANLPTLFVEGASDYIVFKALIEKLRPELVDKVFLAEPPKHAGANYVTNMLRSWEYRARHLPTADRRNACGIVDGDNEGVGAAERFAADLKNPKYVDVIVLDTPEHLEDAIEAGFGIPITLEEMWPSERWVDAAARGWLKPRPKKSLFTEALAERLSEEEVTFGDLIEDDWRVYIENTVDDEGPAKMEWARRAAGRSPVRLEEEAADLLRILDEAVGTLGL